MKKLIFLLLMAPFVVSAQTQLYKAKFSSYRGQLVYSPDQLAIVVSEDNLLGFHSPQTLLRTKELQNGHDRTITSIAFTPDNKSIVTSGLDKKLIQWDYATGVLKHRWIGPDNIIEAAVIDNNRVSVIVQKQFLIYDFQTQKVVASVLSQTSNKAMALASAENTISVAGSDGTVITYDLTGKQLRNFKLSKNNITTLEVVNGGEILAAGFEDGSVMILDSKGGTLGSFSDAKNLIRCLRFSSDGKFLAAGDDWGNCLIYDIDRKSLTEKMKLRNIPILALGFSPDGSTLTAIASEQEISSWDVKRLGIASVFKMKDQKDRTPPQIYISNPPNMQEDKVTIYNDIIEIKGTLMDESGIRGLRVNGIDVPLKANNNFIIIQPLAMGDNAFTVEAKDINDNISIKRFTVKRKSMEGEQYDVSKARNFLFVVGINDYENWPKLNNAVKDANDITNALLRQYNFEFDNLTVLKNEQATRSNIYKGLRSLIEKITPQDNLMIYFSGHGYFDGVLNEGYWIPVDAKVNNSGDYLSNSDILKLIGNIDSQHTFLIADACFSGSLFSESKRGYAENVERYKSRWGLASGRLEVVSDGESGKNSPFATATITFLNENPKEKFAISELVQFVKMKVAETSEQTPLGNPLKVAGDEGGEMVLYKKK